MKSQHLFSLKKEEEKEKTHRIHEFTAKALRATAVEGALGLELGEGGSDGRGRSDDVSSSGSDGRRRWGGK